MLMVELKERCLEHQHLKLLYVQELMHWLKKKIKVWDYKVKNIQKKEWLYQKNKKIKIKDKDIKNNLENNSMINQVKDIIIEVM